MFFCKKCIIAVKGLIHIVEVIPALIMGCFRDTEYYAVIRARFKFFQILI